MDFIDLRMVNVFKQWMEGLPKKARTDISAFIQYLQIMERLERPYTAMLKGECKGLFELRIKVENIQYRPIACHGPKRRQITLLAGAIEVGDKFDPRNICELALRRKTLIHEPGRTYEHSFEEPETDSK